MITIKALANVDDGLVVWQSDTKIPNCLGFAIERRRNGTVATLPNFVGFPGDTGTKRPSTAWPFQRWKWIDHAVEAGDRIAYRVTARIGTPGSLVDGPSSGWSPEATAVPGTPIGAHFNRGIVASQWVARRLGEDAVKNHPGLLIDAMKTPGNALREALSGELRLALLEILDRAASQGSHVHVALFELSDGELIDRLLALGQRAHVVLANGTHEKPKGLPMKDENAAARARLVGKVDLHDRMVHSGLAHNKFLVVVDAGVPKLVWTGSTNWTASGLCGQANNGLVIQDRAVAQAYLDQWSRLRDADGAYPPSLRAANGTPKTFTLGADGVSVWFTPLAGRKDLQAARALIRNAKQAILFLMFNPGPADTLFTTIQETEASNAAASAPLFVRGVLNQDPGGKKQPVLMYDERGIVPRGVDVVLPAAIDDPFGQWVAELEKAPGAHAMIHSKCIVIDPFSTRPIVMTGSHNLGPAASGRNDDNLVIVEGDQALAAAYAVNILGAYGNYRWRENHLRSHPVTFTNLGTDDSWQSWGLTGEGAAERRFWFG
jgi:phosphatidylserine/phosphatidylglycerophosphate/cardiolipin synthase-like enzyme